MPGESTHIRMSSDFTDLLFEAEKLTTSVDSTNDLPKVDRSLRQVLEASNELYCRVAQTGSKDIQANLLLGSKGIDLPKIAQKLDTISARRTFETVQAQEEVDINTYVENEIRNVILKTIEAEHKKSYSAIRDASWQHQMAQWKQEKRKILNAMTAPSGQFIQLVKQNPVFLDHVHTVSTNIMGKSEAIFATKVDEYISSLQAGKPKQNLIRVFATAAEGLRDKKVNEMWEIMKYMTDLPVVPTKEDALKTRVSKPVETKLVSQAKRYLEDRYKIYLNNIVDENRSQAERGGIPGTLPLVRAFVGLRFYGEYAGLEDGLIDGRPFWPTVYYCIRCGDYNAAYQCLQKSNTVREELTALLRLRLRPRGPTSDPNATSNEAAKLAETVDYFYRCTVRNSTDPFKRIVWAVVGGCTGGDANVSDVHSEVAQSVDDYLWLKLSLLSGGTVEGALLGDKGTELYSELQRVVMEDCGESYYDADKSPWTYFQVLTLTGQFEAALEFLSRVERYKSHAIHMAIAMNEMYLLAGPRDYTSPLMLIDPCDRRPGRRLNIVRLVLMYVRSFETTCMAEACDYFYLLHNVFTCDNRNWYVDCVADLTIETGQYELFFGRTLPTAPPVHGDHTSAFGTKRMKGILEKYTHPQLTTQRIALTVASMLSNKGLFEDAIRMYDVGRNQEEALKLLCTLLAQVVHLQKEFGSLRDRLEYLTEAIFCRYSGEGFQCIQNIVDSFLYLKMLLVFFNNYHCKQYNVALKILQDMDLIPFRSEQIEDRLKKFDHLLADVRKVFPDVLLASMNMLYSQYQSIKGNELIPSMLDGTIEKQLGHIRETAKILTNFTGMLPYRMPGDTSSRLVQMEILMH